MDDRHFDNLTRSLALSRRGALRILAGSAAGGLLSHWNGAHAVARQGFPWPRPPTPPRSDDCRRRQDGDFCGTGCAICQSGACVPIADGDPCGQCLTCRDGACRAVPDKEPCGGDCGYCLNGLCEANDEICEGGTNPCLACDPQTLSCAPVREGFPCGGGDCGVCEGGLCVPNPAQCDKHCAACDPDTLTCQPFPDGGACSLNGCGACEGGQCVPSNDRCVSDCAVCVQQGDTFTCVPAVDGSSCGGECGVCSLGLCQPDPAQCRSDCEICDPNSLDCVAVDTCPPCYTSCCHANDSGTCVGPYTCCPDVCSSCVLPGQTPPWDFGAPGACLRWRNGIVGGYCEERPWTCGLLASPCYVNGVAVACCGDGFVCGPTGCTPA